jgi:prepilin-type N-terminal cleavage/methylation domain-containing protein
MIYGNEKVLQEPGIRRERPFVVHDPGKGVHGGECMTVRTSNAARQYGFSLLELLIVIAIAAIAAAVAVPAYRSTTQYLRISGDARNLNGVIGQAKMRAAAEFTHARAYADLGANTFHLEIWNKTGNGGAGCWQTDGDIVGGVQNPCTVVGTSPVQPLSQGVTFGFGTAGAGAPNPQPVIAQAPLCGRNAAVAGVAHPVIENTACIEFNSRGVPIDLTGVPTANDALYVTDQNSVYGVTIIASGMMQDWMTSAATTSWQKR